LEKKIRLLARETKKGRSESREGEKKKYNRFPQKEFSSGFDGQSQSRGDISVLRGSHAG
jgi:hypothetical protein